MSDRYRVKIQSSSVGSTHSPPPPQKGKDWQLVDDRTKSMVEDYSLKSDADRGAEELNIEGEGPFAVRIRCERSDHQGDETDYRPIGTFIVINTETGEELTEHDQRQDAQNEANRRCRDL